MLKKMPREMTKKEIAKRDAASSKELLRRGLLGREEEPKEMKVPESQKREIFLAEKRNRPPESTQRHFTILRRPPSAPPIPFIGEDVHDDNLSRRKNKGNNTARAATEELERRGFLNKRR